MPKPDDRDALRDRIAEALYAHNHPGWATRYAELDQDERDTYLARADAVLAVLPEPTDRAGVLTGAADRIAEMRRAEREWRPATGLHKAEEELRRLAAEAQPARPVDGMVLDEGYAVDVDEEGLPFARIMFAFPASVAGEKRIALVHGITTAVDGARFGEGEEQTGEAQPTTKPDCGEGFDYPRDPDAELIVNSLPPEAQRRIRAQLAAEARQDGARPS